MRDSILAISIVSATACLLSNGAYAQGHGYEGMTDPCATVQACNTQNPCAHCGDAVHAPDDSDTGDQGHPPGIDQQ
jgi:hypothetical protein